METAGTRLLLVDDNPKLCRMVKEYLEPLGYEVSPAHTGTDGLEKALLGDFHAVILDVMLPGLDGFEVLRRLRAKSTAPVPMLTGRGDAPGPIQVSARAREGKVYITVADQGPGVPEDALEEIFAPLYRLDSSRHQETGGSGWGSKS